MKKIFCVILMVCVLFSCACGRATKENCLWYQERSFEAILDIQNADAQFSAVIKSVKSEDKDSMGKDIEVIFTGPESLSGIVLTENDQVLTVKLGEMSISEPSGGLRKLIEFSELFCLDGAPSSFQVEGELTRAVITGSDGDNAVILIDKSGVPKEISRGEIRIRIADFKCLD